ESLFVEGLPGHPEGEGGDRVGRGRPGDLHHVQAEPSRVREESAGWTGRAGTGRGGCRVGRADPGEFEVRAGDPGAYARVGRGVAGEPRCPAAWAGVAEGEPDPG